MRPVDRTHIVGRQIIFDLLELQRPARNASGRLVVQRDLCERIDRQDVGRVRDANALHLIRR